MGGRPVFVFHAGDVWQGFSGLTVEHSSTHGGILMLNISYVTARKMPMLEWFLSSLARECGGDFSALKVIIVDYWANPFGGTKQDHESRRAYVESCVDQAGIPHESFTWLAPKANPWQGKARQGPVDWFNVANSRNTALCYCDDGWVAFVDDLSVLTPGWLSCVAQATQHGKSITLGRYRKVLEVVVEDGLVKSFAPHLSPDGKDQGEDARGRHVKDLNRVHTPCPPDWHFGYVVGPVQAYLDVNGWVETDTAGLSFEDVPTGINLSKKGYSFRYDPRMLALESHELHGQPGGMKRADYGISPNDKSHAVLRRARDGDGWAKNDFFNGMTLAQLRDFVYAKSTNSFPVPPQRYREWYTGKFIGELE